MSYTNRFTQTIIDNSVSKDWGNVKKEWMHIGSYLQPDSNCICGHEIHEVCTIQNNLNGSILEVGNVCVRKFMDIDRRSDFKLIKKDLIDYSLLSELISKKVITQWEADFYKDTKRKRRLTLKQEELRGIIITKSKKHIMKKAPKGIVDPYVFQNLKQTEIMNIKNEHRKMLGDFLVAKGYQISKGGGEKTFTEVFEILKETILQIKKLKDSYELSNSKNG